MHQMNWFEYVLAALILGLFWFRDWYLFKQKIAKENSRRHSMLDWKNEFQDEGCLETGWYCADCGYVYPLNLAVCPVCFRGVNND